MTGNVLRTSDFPPRCLSGFHYYRKDMQNKVGGLDSDGIATPGENTRSVVKKKVLLCAEVLTSSSSSSRVHKQSLHNSLKATSETSAVAVWRRGTNFTRVYFKLKSCNKSDFIFPRCEIFGGRRTDRRIESLLNTCVQPQNAERAQCVSKTFLMWIFFPPFRPKPACVCRNIFFKPAVQQSVPTKRFDWTRGHSMSAVKR